MDKEREEIHLDWKDYVALTLAYLQTAFLPLLLFIVAILILVFVIRFLW